MLRVRILAFAGTIAAIVASLASVPGPVTVPASASPSPTPIYAGLAGSIVDFCARPFASVVGAGTVVTATTWSWLGEAAVVEASARQPRAVTYFASIPPSTPTQSAHAAQMVRCMDAHPLDWSLALADSRDQRAALFDYYRDVLDPCLERHTSAVPVLPIRATFIDGGLTRFDPYRSVRVYSADTALRLQAACPPAPRDVLIRAALIAGALQRGSGA